VNRLLKPFIFLLAGIYFVVDAALMTVAMPVADWLADRKIFEELREWMVSLRPYPTLALFAAPVLVLEPVKARSLFGSHGSRLVRACAFCHR
jgi:hypothetical protein